jgi:hypothetical protein
VWEARLSAWPTNKRPVCKPTSSSSRKQAFLFIYFKLKGLTTYRPLHLLTKKIDNAPSIIPKNPITVVAEKIEFLFFQLKNLFSNYYFTRNT